VGWPDELDVDVSTAAAAVALHDTPVVALTARLSRIMTACAPAGRELQLVTPPTTRLTLPLVSLLDDTGSHWVVYDPDVPEYYDGMSGLPMSWRDGAFRYFGDPAGAPDREPPAARAYAGPPPPSGRQLRLRFEVSHEATGWTRLGGALEAVFRALTGQPPVGWGLNEPVSQLWRTSELTRFARDEVPTHCWVSVVGCGDRPAIGTLEVTRVASGLTETVDLAVGFPLPVEPPLESLAGLADTLARGHRLAWLYAETRLGRCDLTRPAHAEGVPLPVGLALGPEGPELTSSGGVSPAGWLPPNRIGPPQRPTMWYPLSRGDSLVGWENLGWVLERMRQDRSR
jgi:hypothetical protein